MHHRLDDEEVGLLMKTPLHRPRGARGFTLIEMMVTVVLLSILMALAFPAMNGWIRNSRIRTVADALQNGIRLARRIEKYVPAWQLVGQLRAAPHG